MQRENDVGNSAKKNLPSGKNLDSLNGIRALAILSVFVSHMTWALPRSHLTGDRLNYFLGQGWVGVDLFFVLSGFLITGILVDTRNAANYFSGFYARRVLRIFPLYYAVLVGVLIAGRFIHPHPTQLPIPADRKLYFLFLTNWLCFWKGVWGPNVLGHFWSLAVEEQFYLLWPLCVWMVRPKHLLPLCIWLSIVALFIRVIWATHGGLGQAMAMMTFGRMDSLLLGAIGAILFRDAAALRRVRPYLSWIAVSLIGAFFAVVALLFGQSQIVILAFTQTAGYSMLAIGFGAIVLLVADTDGASTLSQQILRYSRLTKLGAYSYGFYVFHIPIIGAAKLAIEPHLPKSLQTSLLFSLVFIIFIGLVSYAISAASYELFERPILSYKRYFKARFIAMIAAEEQV